MRRVAGCLVVGLLASVAAWAGCRDVLDVERQDLAGSDAPGSDAAIATLDAISGSDGGVGSDAGSGSGSDGGVGSDAGSGSGSDGGVGSDGGAGSDDAGLIDAGLIDAGLIDAGLIDAGLIDAGLIDAGIDADTGLGGRHGSDDGAPDRTSFYACAGGGSGAAIGVGLVLPLVAAIVLRRRRRSAARRTS